MAFQIKLLETFHFFNIFVNVPVNHILKLFAFKSKQ